MRKHTYLIVTVASGALAVSDYTANPYTGEREAGKSAIGIGLGSLVDADIGALSSSKKDRDKGAFIGTAVDAVLDGGVGYYIDMQKAKLRDRIRGTGTSVTRSGDDIILSIPNNVTFDNGSVTLKPAGANTLTDVTMALREYPKTAVSVISYADGAGSHDLSMRLSQQRADSVASVLITQGVGASRIHTQGLGPANPVTSNNTAEGKAQNRRVEITLSPL